MPTRETARSVTSGWPPAPRMSPRSARTDDTSRSSPSTSDGSTTDGAQATCQPSSASFSSAAASYSHVADVRSHVQCSVATAVEPVCSTPAVSTRGVAEPISCVIRSYDAWAVVAVSLVNATFDRSLAVNPDASAVSGVLGVRLVGRVVATGVAGAPGGPDDEGDGHSESRRPEVASCRPLYRVAGTRPPLIELVEMSAAGDRG